MNDISLRIAVITGSTREGRFGPTVARWIIERIIERPDMSVDDIDLAEVGLRPHLHGARDEQEQAYIRRLDRADGFVVVTPEYNHSYPAALKQAIDLTRTEWRRKPVAFVSYGGLSGGLRAVEQLRLVFAEMQSTTVRETVSFHGCYERFDEQGQPYDADGTAVAATTMLDDLAWWADVLRLGRGRDDVAGRAA
jgi:NAD(P)H-dependent FMN reductase